MDRRTWLQLLGLLSSSSDQAPAGPRPPQPPPMRVTKEQVAAALILLGLEFQDAEIEMMLRRVNSALTVYENLRKIDIPYGTEPAFAFQPGLPGRAPILTTRSIREISGP